MYNKLSMENLAVPLLGTLIGLPLGYALQRTRLCFNSAYRETLLHRRFILIRMILLAILVQMVGLALLIQFHIEGITTHVVPFFWLGATLGGFIFGIAMVYAEGCSSTVWYRVGNGNLGALATLVGFTFGEWLLEFGPLHNFLLRVQSLVVTLPDQSPATLPNLFGISSWLLIIPLALGLAAWLWRSAPGSYLGGWDWRKGGLILGGIGTLAWMAAWPTGWTYGVGIVGGTGPFIQMFFSGPSVLNWGSFMVLAMPLGAYVAARRKGEFLWQIPNLPSTLRMLSAGVLMGACATAAGGCNIGHTFTGLATLALSSLTATVTIFLGAWFGNYLRFMRH
jgi:uncharacterized protein